MASESEWCCAGLRFSASVDLFPGNDRAYTTARVRKVAFSTRDYVYMRVHDRLSRDFAAIPADVESCDDGVCGLNAISERPESSVRVPELLFS